MVVRPWSACFVAWAVLIGSPAWADNAPAKPARDGEAAKQVAGPALPSRGDKPAESAAKRAMLLNDEAWALYEEGRYRAAIEKLEQAQSLDPNGKDLVYNLALIHEKLANLKQATAYYRRYLEMESDPKARARVQATVRRLEGAQREGSASPSAAGPLAARDAAPAGSRPLRPTVIAAGSFAGAALLVGTIFAVSAVARNPGSSPHTGDGTGIQTLQAEAHTAHAHAVIADVSFVVAASAAVAATILYFTTPRVPPARSASRVTALPGVLGVKF
ncbi:Hypothetical protein A7982_01843 [Minicystis rosea]|nr:Hypothetical protein A7982_01843 [Minicystis rosea]